MAKARGKVTRSNTPRKGYVGLGEPTIEIAAWCPDDEAKEPPKQVHFIFHISGLEEMPLIVRYKSPDTLGFLIEELTAYRRVVWPDAEPVTGEPVPPGQLAANSVLSRRLSQLAEPVSDLGRRLIENMSDDEFSRLLEASWAGEEVSIHIVRGNEE